MKHLFVCPEYPPAPPPPGGIGTYVLHIAQLMADAGETVHVVGTRWEGARREREERCGGRLIIHRVPLDEPMSEEAPRRRRGGAEAREIQEVRGLATAEYRAQRFSFQAALLVERLVEEEGIDVIESQEYDAPLYLFQLRRALGLGPRRTPPCIVQLHSPSEFIFRYNEWDIGRRDFVMAKRTEAFSIGGADALLCPSRYLARQAEAHFGLPSEAITVLRLPIGTTPEQPRPPEVWARDVVCYVGRLEPRKGVIEWIDAAISVADRHPKVHFELVGSDLRYTDRHTMKQFLVHRIPRRLRRRFRFRGSRPREEVIEALRGASIAAVPSRWENFPNTCIEAMCTGTPVLASREGGMAEMIEDGRSGWLADSADPAGLAEALERALAAPPDVRAEMGRSASRCIRAMCDNARTLQAHLEFRERVVEAGTGRSLRLPAILPWAGRRLDDSDAFHPPPRPPQGVRVGVVVTALANGRGLDECLDAVRRQRREPDSSVLVVDPKRDPGLSEAAARARRSGWKVVEIDAVATDASPALRNAGARTLLREDPAITGLVFLDERDRIHEGLLDAAARVLETRPEVAVVSPWTRDARNGRLAAVAAPAFPWQIVENGATAASIFRAPALEEADFFDEGLPSGFDLWDAVSRVMTAGWAAVPLPELLASRDGSPSGIDPARPAPPHVRQTMLNRVQASVARDAPELVLLLEARTKPTELEGIVLTPLRVLRMPLRQQIRVAGKAIRSPRRAARWLAWHSRRLIDRGLSGIRASPGRPKSA